MADYTRQLKKHLKEAGCRFERQGRGDHEICGTAPLRESGLWLISILNLDTLQMQF